MITGLWAHARPPEALIQARAAEERLEKTNLDFPVTLADYLTTLAIGLHAPARLLLSTSSRRRTRQSPRAGATRRCLSRLSPSLASKA